MVRISSFAWISMQLYNNLHISSAFSIQRDSYQPINTAIKATEASEEDGGIGVGIDLGTTNSAIAFLEGNSPRMIAIPNNGNTMKSVVAYFGDNEAGPAPLIGKDAVDWESKENKSAYRHVKRVMGTGADYVPKEILGVVPYAVAIPTLEEKKKKKKKKKPSLQKLLDNADDNPVMLSLLSSTTAETISPEQISAVILDKLLSEARKQTKQKISRAVIGVPAYFNDAQRDATVRAANLAGIEKVKLLREPEAAALAYGVDKGKEEEELVLVFDLGGGTYDVSILLVERGLTEIVCTSGDSQLGGSNFDAKIAKFVTSLLPGCGRSATASDSILRTAEAIRIYLSNNRFVMLALPLTDDAWSSQCNAGDVILPVDAIDDLESRSKNSTHFFYEMTRKEMEALCLAELKMLLRPIREVAIMAGALLPGDTRPSIVETALEIDGAFSDEEAFYTENDELDESSVAAIGGAVLEMDLQAAKKQQQRGRKKARQTAKKERKFREETKKVNEAQPDTNLRGDGISGRPITRLVLVGGATRMPAIGRFLSALTGCPPIKTVDPDEAVALGCAVHVGVLDGNEELGTVLNPLQAALLRAVIKKENRDGGLDDMFDDDDDDGFF
ncbi:MAG: hypothetical protein SGBAC_007554 [Bacillariaceae sp.]